MEEDDQIVKIQHDFYEFVEYHKKLNTQITLGLHEYISSFSVNKIDEEIANLCTDLKKFKEIRANTNLIKNLVIPKGAPKFYSDQNFLLHVETVNKLDDINQLFLTYYLNKKANNKYDGKIFDISDNNVMILDLAIQIINKIHSRQKHNKNIVSCYQISHISNLANFENIYRNKFENKNINSIDLNKIVLKLEHDLNIIKMHYLDAILFIKDQETILSNYPDDFEKITQMKIIELNKYKLYLLYSD